MNSSESGQHHQRDSSSRVEELEAQAIQLEEQASEMEALNEELLKSEARLRSLVDSSLDAIVTTDQYSVITSWNHHAERIFGWTEDEAIGKRLTETIIPPRYREAHDRGVERYLATGEGPLLNRRVEITGLHRAGREVPVELTVSPARWGTGEVVLSAFIRDISERIEAQRRQQAEHTVMRLLAESHTVEDAAPGALSAIGEAFGWELGALWLLDEVNQNLRCVGVWNAEGSAESVFVQKCRNSRFGRGEGLPGRVWEREDAIWIPDIAEASGFPRASFAADQSLHAALGMPVTGSDGILGVLEFFHKEIAPPDDEALEAMRVISSGIGQAVQRIRAEEERVKALHEMERVAAELRVERARLREVFDKAPALISVTRGPDHVFELVNTAYRRMVDDRELEGKPLREALPELAGQGFFETRDEVYASGEPLIRNEAPITADLDADGEVEEYFLNFLTQPLRNAEGEVEGILTFAVDVSEQVRARSLLEEQAAELEAHTEELQTQAMELQELQAALEETNEQLQSANVAKSEFLATMSHELRTPLNAIIGYADLLLNGVPETIPDPSAKQVERISLSAHHLRELIEEILAFSRMEAGRETVSITTADVGDILAEVRSIMEPLASERPVDLSIEEPDESISVQTDPHKVRQILLNLTSNALKFTESGSISLTVDADDDWVRFPLRDTGVGIDEENLEKIFEPFWQADSSHTRAIGGTGLGLGVSKRFAELLGGTLSVESRPGNGSTFTLALPRHQPMSSTDPYQPSTTLTPSS